MKTMQSFISWTPEDEERARTVRALAGAIGASQVTDSFKDKRFQVPRKQLEAAGVLKANGDQLVFAQDYVFKSPSAAAAVVVGNNTNGWMHWKTKEGKTLDAVVRQTEQ